MPNRGDFLPSADVRRALGQPAVPPHVIARYEAEHGPHRRPVPLLCPRCEEDRNPPGWTVCLSCRWTAPVV